MMSHTSLAIFRPVGPQLPVVVAGASVAHGHISFIFFLSTAIRLMMAYFNALVARWAIQAPGSSKMAAILLNINFVRFQWKFRSWGNFMWQTWWYYRNCFLSHYFFVPRILLTMAYCYAVVARWAIQAPGSLLFTLNTAKYTEFFVKLFSETVSGNDLNLTGWFIMVSQRLLPIFGRISWSEKSG